MAEINSFDEVFKDYWSSVAGGLSQALNDISTQYSKSDFNKAVTQAELADRLASQYDHFSQRASDLAKSASKAGMEIRPAAQNALDSASILFKQHAENLRTQGMSALDRVDSHLLNSVNRDMLAKTAAGLGVATDVLDIAVKSSDGDYYGAAASFVAAVATAALAAFIVGTTGWIAIPLLFAFSIVTAESFEGIFNYLDPLGINSDVNTDFMSALNFIQRSDPLALDLDGNGIETVSANAGIVFDFNGDGLKTGTGWVKGGDGILVRDLNGDGVINNGSELFGIDTVKSTGDKATDGFDALRDLDSNGDGVFDFEDANFSNVLIWQDLNQDGISQKNELKALAEHNIIAINLNSDSSSQNTNGNIISAIGSFVRADNSSGEANGEHGQAANLDLASNPFFRDFTDSIALDSQARALPNMQGSGAVRDLQEASMLNSELKEILASYAASQTRQEQMALLGKH